MKKRFFSCIFAILIIFTACSPIPPDNIETVAVSGEAVFHFIDVGQGDCTLIQTDDAAVLIDAGTTESGSVIYEYLTNIGVDYLDCFIGTHPHEDHLGGAAAVLSGIDVGTVYLNGDSSSSYFYEKFVDILLDKDISAKIPNMDCIYEFGSLRVKFLSPNKDFGDTNNNSLVAMVQFGETKALFTGDAERSVEAELVSGNYDIRADILKVGHHGSRYSSSAEFLNMVMPGISVVQCGKDNSYGHPHEEAVERLEKVGSAILRCDELGTIRLTSDGKNIYNSSGELYESEVNTTPIEQTYIGNKKSRVFHCEACPNLPGEKNRVDFNSRDEAVSGGYTPCGNCNP